MTKLIKCPVCSKILAARADGSLPLHLGTSDPRRVQRLCPGAKR